MTNDVRSPAVAEERLRAGAETQRGWGTGLLAVAAVLWVYAMFLLFTPYTSTYGAVSCSPVAVADRSALYDASGSGHDAAVQCARTRDTGRPTGALGLSLPFAGAGAILFTRGALTLRLRAHERTLASVRPRRP